MLDEDYGFLLVDESEDAAGGGRPCTDAELNDLYANLTDTSEQPRCLRSLQQLTQTEYTFPGGERSTFRNYFCANQATFTGEDGSEDCPSVNCADGQEKRDNPCCCALWHDEICFSSASHTSVSIVFIFALSLLYYLH